MEVIKKKTFSFKMPKYSVNVRRVIFRSHFKHTIDDRYSRRDTITFLGTSIKGEPLDFTKGIGSDYGAAWEYLDSIHDDSRYVSDTITQAIVKFRLIRHGEDAQFCRIWYT